MIYKQLSLIDNGRVLTQSYDLTGGDKTFSANITTQSLSLSVIARSLTGTLNGTIKLYGSNVDDLTKAVQIGSTIDLTSASITDLIDDDVWNPAYIFVELKVVGITGGTLELPCTLK